MRRIIVKYIVEILSGFVFALGVLGLVHQKLYTGSGWFSWQQFWHHEPLIVISFISFLMLLTGKYANRILHR